MLKIGTLGTPAAVNVQSNFGFCIAFDLQPSDGQEPYCGLIGQPHNKNGSVRLRTKLFLLMTFLLLTNYSTLTQNFHFSGLSRTFEKQHSCFPEQSLWANIVLHVNYIDQVSHMIKRISQQVLR